MTAIIDYGVGNIFSLCSSLEYIGEKAVLTSDKKEIERAERIILPGVGAFGDAAEKLKKSGLWDAVISSAEKKPLLGICLGMQLLLEKSMEFGEHKGLGLISGAVLPVAEKIPAGLKIPHIGWNALYFPQERKRSPIFEDITEGEHAYFVHSYYAAGCGDAEIAYTEYKAKITAAVGNGENVFGVQFHPEKSGDTGLKILRSFCKI